MKLNKWDKEAFVSAVMRDVPKIDYVEKFRKAAEALALSKMPPKLRAVEEDKKLSGYLTRECGLFPKDEDLPEKIQGRLKLTCYTVVEVTWSEVPGALEMQKAHVDQALKRDALRVKVEAAIAGCTTRAQALKMMPEFEKYLPFERAPKQTLNLPAVANLATDLMAAGWPDGGKPK